MAVASKPKPTAKHHKKRTGAHHRQSKQYVKSYWPYLPMLVVVISGIIANSWLQKSAVLGMHTSLTSSQLLSETNVARQQNKLSYLTLNSQLTQAAQAKADDMAHKNYWSHTAPDGTPPWQFIQSTGYTYGAAGENLAYGFDNASVVTNAWLHSPEHRENLLNAGYSEVGYGISHATNYLGSGPQNITVALYARPALGAVVSHPQTITPAASQSVSRVGANLASASAGFLVGIIGALSLLFVVFRHGIIWRRLLNRGELFVVQHPALDISLIGVATVAVVLSQTAGFIR